MKTNILILLTVVFFFGCSKEAKVISNQMPQTFLQPVAFSELPDFNENNFDTILDEYLNNCRTTKAQKIYKDLCTQAVSAQDAKKFILANFQAYKIVDKTQTSKNLLTGYFEMQLHGSLRKSEIYKYPIYAVPRDLISVDLSAIYPELKHLRLRGRLEGNKIVPYMTRKEIKKSNLNAAVICYVDSQIDRFFLEVQGSGKVFLDDGRVINVGYANNNGHKYSSIGKYLIQNGEIDADKISLQSIRTWLEAHPKKVDAILNQNKSMVFFAKKDQGATGALGLELKAGSSVAVDPKYIPLGSMLYLNSHIKNKRLNRFVFAQDVGGAIKGALRVDYFLGATKEAQELAGELKSPLHLWVILPKEVEKL